MNKEGIFDVFLTDRTVYSKLKQKKPKESYNLIPINELDYNEIVIGYRDHLFFLVHMNKHENIDCNKKYVLNVVPKLIEEIMPRPSTTFHSFELNENTIKNLSERKKPIYLNPCGECGFGSNKDLNGNEDFEQNKKRLTNIINCKNKKIILIKFQEDVAPSFTKGIKDYWNVKFNISEIIENIRDPPVITNQTLIADFHIKLPTGAHSPSNYTKKRKRQPESINKNSSQQEETSSEKSE